MKMAGMAQVLSHRDISHAGDALIRLNNLRREGILCDLTILVEGREHKAHKVVMAACSDYFLNAICGGKTTATVTPGDRGCVTVDLEHVTLRGFTPLLDYAYTASLQVNAADVIDVLSAASYMQMFKVANACSEFIRSNIMWAQSIPRLANLPGMNLTLLNGSKHSPQRSLSPSSGTPHGSGISSDMSSLLKATSAMSAAGRAAIGQPPLLIPIHSMGYDGLHQLAASMAGTQNLLSRAVGVQHQAMTAASAISSPLSTSSPRNSSHSPSSVWPTVTSSMLGSSSHPSRSKGSTSPKPNDRPSSRNVNGGGGRKSFAVKIESRSDDEDSQTSTNGIDYNGDQVKSISPTESEPVEDSWQALQKLYSIRMTEAQTHRHHPYLPRPSSRMEDREDSRSTDTCDREDPNNNEGSPMEAVGSPALSEPNGNSNNNNSNNNPGDSFVDFIHKMAPKTDGLAMVNSSQDIFPPNMRSGSPSNVHSTAAVINGAMRSALAQQQQLLTTQQNGTDPTKMVDLPVMPPNGQYMSVRRRTLQSTVPKPHQCQICGSRFTRFHNLKQHIKLHSGIKPYECDECGKRFTRNYTLRLHKMKHVGIRNFRCGTCDASFTSLGEFRAHLRITLHSHVAGGAPSSLGGNSPGTGISEPEDLTSPMPQNGAHMTSKYRGYDATMLGFQRGVLGGDRASLLSVALGGAMMMRDNGSLAGGSSAGAGSPQLSDRSISPQDLTTKTGPARNDRFEAGKPESTYSPENAQDGCDSQNVPTSGDGGEKKMSFYGNPTQTKTQLSANGPESLHGSTSPTCRTASPTSERDGTDSDGRDVMQVAETSGYRDTDPDESNDDDDASNANSSSKSNDQPMSLVVNASA